MNALSRASLVDQAIFEQFFSGFNRAGERYLIIDVGDGKEMADSRIKCAHVFNSRIFVLNSRL
jgi:hypothetical protein